MTTPAPLACDVLVVGLGPAGASAARAAAAAGLRVVAVDRRAVAGLPVQCAEFVPLSLGSEVDDLAASVVQPIEAMDTYLEDAAARRDALPGWIIDRARFDARLAEAAARAGADCRFATALTALAADGTATLADGTWLAPKAIVGADGPRSLVGRTVGRENTVFAHTRQVTVPLLVPHRATDIWLSAGMPGGYAWLFPKGDVANVGLGVAADHRRHLPALLDGLLAMLAREGRIAWDVQATTGGLIPSGGPLAPHARLGAVDVLLAGDACGLTNPVTGAGIASAVVSGRMAGEAVAARLAGDADACADWVDEVEALFARALARATRRRADLMATFATRRPDPDDLARAWIAYDAYWRDDTPSASPDRPQGVAA